MARIDTYDVDTNISSNDMVIGTDGDDNNKTKNFTVGALAGYVQGLIDVQTAPYTAGTGISIANNVISSTVVDTDSVDYISNVALNGNNLVFTGVGRAASKSVDLSSIASSGSSLHEVLIMAARTATINAGAAESTVQFYDMGSSLKGGESIIKNQSLLIPALPNFRVSEPLLARVEVAAFMRASSNNDTVILRLYADTGRLMGQTQFDFGRSGDHVASFFLNFELDPSGNYVFTAEVPSSSGDVTILSGSQFCVSVIQ